MLQHVFVSQYNITCWRTRAVSEFVWTAHDDCPKNLSNVFVRWFKVFYWLFLACWAALLFRPFVPVHCCKAALANRLITFLALFWLVEQIQADTASHHLFYRIANDVLTFHWSFVFLTFVDGDPSMDTVVLFWPNENTVSVYKKLCMLVSLEVDWFD